MRYLILLGIFLIQSCSGLQQKSSRLPANLIEPLHEEIQGCFVSTTESNENDAKSKRVSESKSVVFRANEEFSSSLRYPLRREEYGKIILMTGSHKFWLRSLHSMMFSEKPHEVAAFNKHFQIQAPDDTVLEARIQEHGLYLVKDSEGLYKAVLLGATNVTLDECTTDEEVVKEWIREVSKYW